MPAITNYTIPYNQTDPYLEFSELPPHIEVITIDNAGAASACAAYDIEIGTNATGHMYARITTIPA